MMALALTLSAASPGVAAEGAKAPPPDIAACDFRALANDSSRAGLNIRAEPRADAAILGRLPMIENINHERIAPDVRVIGVKKGWFLIEDAAYGDYDLPEKLPPLYRGRGWVSGKLLTVQVRMHNLKAAPDDNAADLFTMSDDYGATAILDCKGDWLSIETPIAKTDASPKTQPANGGASGWTRGVCVNQRTTCGG